MAQYKFETKEEPKSDLKFEVRKNSRVDRFLDGIKHHGYISVTEDVAGVLVISEMNELEKETAKRAIFATPRWEIKNQSQYDDSVIEFDPHERVEKLEELNNGSLSSAASLSRFVSKGFDKRNKIDSTLPLPDPRIVSYAGNMSFVRSLMLAGIEDEFRKDGDARENHFVDIASTADRMHHEILEVVQPALLAVHGLTLERMQSKLSYETATA